MKNILFFILFSLIVISVPAQKESATLEIGVVQDLENDSLLYAYGYRYLVESTSKLFSPKNVSDQQFETVLQKIKKLKTPLFGTNLFIPGALKVVGPVIDEKAVLSYVEIVFKRGHAAGIKMIIWGSGGSRGIPEGFDRTKAKEQFVSMARKIATLAKKYNIILALENLNSTECNFINTVAEAYDVVKAVDHENFRLCVDIYHMLKEGESAAVIEKTKKYLVYCEIAERENRTPPGVRGDDFRPYLQALKKIGYLGKIIIECRWDDIQVQGASAYQYLHKQIKEVYKN
ncbi:MAG TPA: sugar phosphate isomerase/epimerase family protein [Chryseolinea sp.]|nr:sugar phosphate isomerase/epimerase family protein [Chryseolinea sp.]